nr:SIS domain-containing protein [Ipomoea batatas]
MSLILNLVRTATLFSDGFADWAADQDHRALVNLHRPVGNSPGPLEMKNTSVIRMFLRQGDLEKCGDNPEHASMGDEKCVFSMDSMIEGRCHAEREDLGVFTIRIIVLEHLQRSIGCAVTEEIKVFNAGWCLGDTEHTIRMWPQLFHGNNAPWEVDVQGLRFSTGWVDFCEALDIKLEDEIVFQHMGFFKFQFFIFRNGERVAALDAQGDGIDRNPHLEMLDLLWVNVKSSIPGTLSLDILSECKSLLVTSYDLQYEPGHLLSFIYNTEPEDEVNSITLDKHHSFLLFTEMRSHLMRKANSFQFAFQKSKSALFNAAEEGGPAGEAFAARFAEDDPLYFIAFGPAAIVSHAFGLCVLQERFGLDIHIVDSADFFHSFVETLRPGTKGHYILIIPDPEDASRGEMLDVKTFFDAQLFKVQVIDAKGLDMSGIDSQIRRMVGSIICEAFLKPWTPALAKATGRTMHDPLLHMTKFDYYNCHHKLLKSADHL